ncbi:MAG TPA: FtsX-like permease family protein, partial [Ruminiclostridium sp.]|nr:FtsX-like permease family protein [Ruminiclostridium sp.]
MKRANLKDTIRELWKTRSRFLAIFAIIALGTGFFAGVKVTCPDMKLTADKYFKDYHLMDLKVASTYGLNKDDISAIKGVSGVRGMMPAYSMDAIIKTDAEDRVAKIHSVPLDKMKENSSDYINGLRIVEGRLPEKSGECVVEKGKINSMDLKLGDTIKLTSGKEDKSITDYLDKSEYRIVGYVDTPYYLTFEKGTSTLGNGTVSIYVMIPQEDFKMEVYTEAFLTFNEANDISSFSPKYKDLMENKKTQLEDIAKTREKQRFDEVYGEANSKLEKAKKDLAEGEKKQKEQLGKAEVELEKHKTELENGRKQLESNKTKYTKEISAGEAQLGTWKKAIEDGEKQYSQKLLLFSQGKAFMKPEQAAAAQTELNAARRQLDLQQGKYAAAKALLDKKKNEGAVQLKAAEKKLDAGQTALDKGQREYDKSKKESDAKLSDARKKIADSEKKLSDMEKPKWYIMDRKSNPGYSSYGDDADRVDAISKIFPVFFFVVAAFVCLTTMTRMVEEQRTQIGTYKALGYGSMAIASKFLIYAATASALGSIAGLAVGLKLFPFVIINAYSML